MLDVAKLKKDFPIFDGKGGALVYLDNAATSQKPAQVINALSDFYGKHNANVHRGIYELSETATQMYEGAREKVARFIGARAPDEVIFTSGTTQTINLVAGMLAGVFGPGTAVLVTNAEHHSNFVPWQQVAKRTGAAFKVVAVDDNGAVSLDDFSRTIKSVQEQGLTVRVVAFSHVSNVLGTELPVKGIVKVVKELCGDDVLVVVDGAQAVPHLPVNVQGLGCDFYAFSGHKMLGPTGTGVLWGKRDLLEGLAPAIFGGGMINEVTQADTSWAALPQKFEAGTPNIAGAIGLGAAIDYLSAVGMANIQAHDADLAAYALEKLSKIAGVRILGPQSAQDRRSLVAFVVAGIHAHDVAAVLAQENVCVRAGHHCTMPLNRAFGAPASVRASFYLYNTRSDVDKLIAGLHKAIAILKTK